MQKYFRYYLITMKDKTSTTVGMVALVQNGLEVLLKSDNQLTTERGVPGYEAGVIFKESFGEESVELTSSSKKFYRIKEIEREEAKAIIKKISDNTPQ